MAKERIITPEERRHWRQAMGEEPADSQTVASAVASAPVAARPAMPVLPPLSVLDGRQAARMLRPHAPVGSVLDLHGLGKIEAYGQVQDFIRHAAGQGLRHVLVITGKGRLSEGVLRANLPHWLNEPGLRPLISAIAQANPGRGGGGVFHVLLKARR